jgi:general secretion pathway protein N
MTRRPPPYRSQTPWGWATSGALAGLLLAVAVFAPASWLASALQQASSGRVLLSDARGTVWSGSAQFTLAGGAGSHDSATLPSRLEWQLGPRWGYGVASFYTTCCTQKPLRLTLVPRWSGVEIALADAQSTWPASLLSGLGTPWNTLQPAGLLVLSSQGLVVTMIQGSVSIVGRAQLEALDLSSRLSTLQPLGSYRLTLQGGAVAGIELATLKGSLQLAGSGHWVGSRLHFEGAASAAPERLEALSNLLNIIGRRDGAQSIISMG